MAYVLAVSQGGTGLTSFGTPGQALIVNSSGNGLTWGSVASGSTVNTLRTVSGTPSSSLGIDGDYAIDPTAQLIYGPKASGSWPTGVSYKGNTGNTGSTGNTGATGRSIQVFTSVPSGSFGSTYFAGDVVLL